MKTKKELKKLLKEAGMTESTKIGGIKNVRSI